MEEMEGSATRTEKKKLITFTLVCTVCAASIGSGFQHGYNAGVLNAPQSLITSWMNETLQTTDEKITAVWSVTISIVCAGGMIGGAVTGILSTKLGRRKTLLLNNVLAIIAGLFMGSAKYVNRPPFMLIIGRFISGVNAGLNAGVAPMYLSEISPMRLRGAIGSMYQLVITLSILLAQLVSIDKALGTEQLWPIMLYLIIIPAVYQIIALWLAPESPKYLLEQAEEEKALSSCIKLGGEIDGPVNLEIIRKEINEAMANPKVKMSDMCKVRKYRNALIIMCLLMSAQQLSGINAVIYYSTQIFTSAHLTASDAQLATVGVGIVNVITTVASVFLIELVGRKPLLALGFGGMSIVLIALTICLFFIRTGKVMSIFAIVLVYVYIVLFAVGAGPIPWILGSELFTTAARPVGVSAAVTTNWFMNFVVGIMFLPAKEAMGPFVFVIFIICNVAALVFFSIKVPETKNRPIEEITAQLE